MARSVSSQPEVEHDQQFPLCGELKHLVYPREIDLVRMGEIAWGQEGAMASNVVPSAVASRLIVAQQVDPQRAEATSPVGEILIGFERLRFPINDWGESPMIIKGTSAWSTK